jgi:hypothetical protein
MLRLQDKLLEEFSHATIEDDYYRVGNIFYFLKAKRLFVNMHIGENVIRGRIVRVVEDRIRIFFPQFKETQERRAVLTFEALNRYYFCEILIINTERDVVDIQYPGELKYITRRLYPRVEFDDLFMRFITLYSQFFNSKDEERILENAYPHFFQEIKEDHPSLRVLYGLITDEVKKITSDFEVKMFHKNDILNFDSIIESLVMGEGRTLLVEDTSILKTYTRRYEQSPLIETMYGRHEHMSANQGKEKADLAIVEIQKNDISNFRLSYFALPIVIFDRPRGYFIMRTNVFDKRIISVQQAEDIAKLFRIFSYAVTKVSIRTSHYDPITIRTRVVNISMSGLLMEIEDATLYEYLKKNRRIKMLIPVMGDELEIYGEITRFYAQGGYFYMGIMFFKTRPGDMVKLEDFIYENRSYQFF